MVDANSESVPISSDCRAVHLHAAHPLHRAHVVLLKIGAKKKFMCFQRCHGRGKKVRPEGHLGFLGEWQRLEIAGTPLRNHFL